MQNLIIDIGNTYTKIYVFENEKIVSEYKYTSFNPKQSEKIKKLHPNIQNAILSTVKETDYEIFINILPKSKTFFFLDNHLKFPFENKYKTPETLGKDRLAAAAAAVFLYPQTNVLVIDAGTAITYEFITDKGRYLGGNIAPGLQTRFRSLHQFTGKLPLLKPNFDLQNRYGQNTTEAIQLGVQNGIIAEMEYYIADFENHFKNPKVILTGGDSFFFADKLKKTIFAKPNFLAYGLYAILLHNI